MPHLCALEAALFVPRTARVQTGRPTHGWRRSTHRGARRAGTVLGWSEDSTTARDWIGLRRARNAATDHRSLGSTTAATCFRPVQDVHAVQLPANSMQYALPRVCAGAQTNRALVLARGHRGFRSTSAPPGDCNLE